MRLYPPPEKSGPRPAGGGAGGLDQGERAGGQLRGKNNADRGLGKAPTPLDHLGIRDSAQVPQKNSLRQPELTRRRGGVALTEGANCLALAINYAGADESVQQFLDGRRHVQITRWDHDDPAALRRLVARRLPWRVTLADHEGEFEVNTRPLLSFAAFRRRALIALSMRLPPLSDEQWLRIVGEAMQQVIVDQGDQ
jgi:hypothetical protein